MRKACLTLGLVLSLVGLLFHTSVQAAGESQSKGRAVDVRVMSYNIQGGRGTDGVYDLDRIAEVIRQSEADVVGLQEVDVHWGSRSDFENGIKLLAEKLNMRYFFAPIYDLPPYEMGEPNRQFGVAVLSKYPIIKAENREITRLSTQVPDPVPELAPGFAEVSINAKGAKFNFHVTHLDYRGDPTVRMMQVDDMMRIFSENNRPKILAGDLNAVPTAPELSPLFDTFFDAWTVNDFDEGKTYPADHPTKRIDYLLTSRDIHVKSAHVVQTLASDHLPVIADVTLIRGQ